ncbi:aryl-sulfate sulfotransferase [Sphingobacterium sp. SYP-B4668]|uniref:aryl-sulfate sulfotransferase n=1 Tax=Sphingobacterium sp. SYP-B4668 TaxID=2996035 RepID=UPI000532740E|nr:aryl-sulfate sulfotransferase [Sphingobacterium sp. SYP-B4668]
MKSDGIYVAVMGICLFLMIACKKEISRDDLRIEQMHVDYSKEIGLSARLRIGISTVSDLMIRYYAEGRPQEVRELQSSAKREHIFGLLDLKENTRYRMDVSAVSQDGQRIVLKENELILMTEKIPDEVRGFYKQDESKFGSNLPGYFMFANMSSPSCTYILNNEGDIVWFRRSPNTVKCVRFTQRNTILTVEDEDHTPFGDGNILLETTLAGDTVFFHRKGRVGFDKSIHHDAILNHRGHYVAVTNELKGGYPGDGLVEWDAKGNKVWEWSTFDARGEYDADMREQPWINSVFQDKDSHYIVSLRALHQVWKINSTTGAVMWKLGGRGNVNMDNAGYFMFQHYAHMTTDGKLLLFDNGGEVRKHSRIISFQLDELQMNASIQHSIRLPQAYYSAIMGSVQQIQGNHFLVASSVKGVGLLLDESGKIYNEIVLKDRVYRMEYLEEPFRFSH